MSMRFIVAVAASVQIWAALHSVAQVTSPPLSPSAPPGDTFTNPLLETGPDPWVVWWKGFYYYSNSSGTNLTLRKTGDITDLRHAEKKAVWTPEPGHEWSDELWAPELHHWGNKWYIYFAADAGDNASHRIYVVENDSDDPIEGTWTFKAKVSDSSNKWAIDPTTFELKGEHYLVWSGWKGDEDGEQDLFIATSLSTDWPSVGLGAPNHLVLCGASLPTPGLSPPPAFVVCPHDGREPVAKSSNLGIKANNS